MRKIHKYQHLILTYLNKQNSPSLLKEVVEALSLDQIFVSSHSQALEELGYVNISEEKALKVKLRDDGVLYKERGLPERQIMECLQKHGGKSAIKDIPELTGLSQKEVGDTLKVLKKKKWVENQRGVLVQAAEDVPKGYDEEFMEILSTEYRFIDELCEVYKHSREAFLEIQHRKSVVAHKETTLRYLSISEQGKKLIEDGISPAEEVSLLTSDMIVSGAWKDVIFRTYDTMAGTAPVFPGKLHPFRKVLNFTRKTFLELGFEEAESPYVDSAFWVFDSLFQPQDHPAREMQDTFFLKHPSKLPIVEQDAEEAVRNVHENGGDTGSCGWGYKWEKSKAEQAVLRTHTTAATIHEIFKKPEGPRKLFTIGKVFRRETVDYKHLPIFTQVDGIIVDSSATFSDLLGIITTFYKKMGFDKLDFRPGYFPYTEPSLEVYVYLPKKKDWVEMGGAGIFREEVTQPFGCEGPVLAWGLGLERLAMMKYDMDSIRDLYLPDIQWLRETPQCL